MKPRNDDTGPALFSYGFRPFFLAATLFGLGVVPLWWLVWRGNAALASAFAPTDWHSHEMIFGYGTAVVAGFLFTAIPNWTGRLPTKGWPPAMLLAIWIAGRIACSGLTGLGPLAVLVLDQAFMLAVAAMIAREIIAGKNWKNLKVLVPVTLLWLANIGFHVEAMTRGEADTSRRLGIALLIFLIMLIGGRIVPSFTRNWLVRRDGARLPVAFNRFDVVAILSGVLALIAWVLFPLGLACAILSAVATVVHGIRLVRWRGLSTWPSPLLLMLHVAYLFVPLGFLAVAAGPLGLVSAAIAAHIFGIGAIGGMTVAVMMRATLGHTGRELVAGTALTAAFASLIIAALLRALGDWASTIGLATAAWSLAYVLLAWRLAPILARPKAARRSTSPPPSANAGTGRRTQEG